MKWPRVAIPVRLGTPIRTAAPVEPYHRHHYAFEVQDRVMPVWDEVALCRDSGEARNTIPEGAPVETYLQRHTYAFEVQERVMPGWEEVAPGRDTGEARNTNPDGAPVKPYFQHHPYAFQVQIV